jgi:uncharacterized protein (TIGR03067 family)
MNRRLGLFVVACCFAFCPSEVRSQDLTKLKPGSLVIVDFGGETVGEFIEYQQTGRLKVRVRTRFGNEQTLVFPPRRVRNAGPQDKFGDNKQAEVGPMPGRPAVPRPNPRPPEQPKSNDAGAARKLVDEEMRALSGSWKVVKNENVGVAETGAVDFKIVFADKQLIIGGKPMSEYRLDPTKSPKHLTYTTSSPAGYELNALYELDGEWLQICVLSGGKRPTSLDDAGAKGARRWTCKRNPDISKSPLKTPAEADAALLSTLDSWSALIQAGKQAEFVRISIHVAQLPSQRPLFDDEIAIMLQNGLDKIGPAPAAARRVVPTMGGRTKAEFDLADWHVPGAIHENVALVKLEGRWYLDLNRLQPIQAIPQR